MGFVGDPIQLRCGERGVCEYLRLVAEAMVRSDDHGYSLVAFGGDLKEQLRPLFGKRDIAKFVNHQKTITGIKLNDTAETILRSGLDQFIGQATAGHKPGAHPLAARRNTQGRGQMCFTGAASAKEDHISGLFDIPAVQKLPDQPGVQIRRLRPLSIRAVTSSSVR